MQAMEEVISRTGTKMRRTSAGLLVPIPTNGFKKGNPGKPKGALDKAARAVKQVYECMERDPKGVAGFLDDLRVRNPDLLFQMWCKLQPRETHTTIESRRLVFNITRAASPLADVPANGTQPILDVVPTTDTNAT